MIKKQIRKKLNKAIQLDNKLLKKINYVETHWNSFNIANIEDRIELKKEVYSLRKRVQKEIMQFEDFLKQLEQLESNKELLSSLKEANKIIETLKERIDIVNSAIKAIR